MNKKVKIKNSELKGDNWQTINRGKPIYYDDIKHYIFYEFDDFVMISRNKEMTSVYCVKKHLTHH